MKLAANTNKRLNPDVANSFTSTYSLP